MVGAMRGPLHPFRSPICRQRQFVRFWFGESVSMIGSSVTNFALPLVAVITLEVSPSQMGLLRGLGAAPGILIGLFAGVWVDRVSRKGLLISTGLIAAAVIASVPVALRPRPALPRAPDRGRALLRHPRPVLVARVERLPPVRGRTRPVVR